MADLTRIKCTKYMIIIIKHILIASNYYEVLKKLIMKIFQ